MRLAVVLMFATVVCGLVYFVLTHPNLERLDELEMERDQLAAQNRDLAEQNDELERQILALREDPRLAERRARESVGLARPEELIFQFDASERHRIIEVGLEVGADGLMLAGEEVAIEALGDELEVLHRDIPEARLVVDVGDEVGPVERQRIINIVEASALGAEHRFDDEDR